MGFFGDFFDDPLFDLDGNGNVDAFEEAVAFDWFFSDDSDDDDFDSDDEDLFDDDDDSFDD